MKTWVTTTHGDFTLLVTDHLTLEVIPLHTISVSKTVSKTDFQGEEEWPLAKLLHVLSAVK